jgi:hypothetical protein
MKRMKKELRLLLGDTKLVSVRISDEEKEALTKAYGGVTQALHYMYFFTLNEDAKNKILSEINKIIQN